MPIRLAQDFYNQDTIELARALLGQTLVHQTPDGRRLSGRIVETEAYLGVEDAAAHSFGGRRTARTEPMFGAARLSYVYFIYGMYFCFNIVAQPHGIPEAVLIRALDLNDGSGNGPGKLCRALGLDLCHNGLDLKTSSILWLEQGSQVGDHEIIDGPRVGLNPIHDACHWPLRFGLRGNPALSPVRFPPA